MVSFAHGLVCEESDSVFFLNVGNESFSLGNRLKWSGYSWDIEAIVLIMRRRQLEKRI